MAPLRLLVLTSAPPYPLTDGARIAIFEPLARLAARGHAIDLLTFGPPDDPALPTLRAFCRDVILVDDQPTARRWLTRARSPFHHVPYLVSLFRSDALATMMKELIAARPYDAVQVEALSMADYIGIARASGLPVILRTQNVESSLCARQAELARGVRRWHYRHQHPKLATYEAARCAEVDLCVALTVADERRLAALTPSRARVAVIAAGVDLETYAPVPPEPRRPPSVLFTGTMNYPPNDDGVLWFLDTIWPMVSEAVPDATFTVVGKDPSRGLRRRADGRRIIVTGLVEDVRPWIERATVCVAPLRVGGGMRIKILQAMAMARPIVSTTLGAEGIDLKDRREAYLADGPSLFARRVTGLLANPALCHSIGAAARARAERQYGWEPLVDRLEDHYRAIVSSASRPPFVAPATALTREERTA